ncbi:WD40/YVTN repeat-like-containing domain [Phytophthora cinnamomi]|uniref:WD40/YVTN repeat-like-containing domain n=1 Tax=Phytophthora cinnamomi TaxID=4785 RepID=UPI003559C4E1|nr:WD40/YVTN repeat-like-containing domain [Phytophthora cinnamomi]
MQQEVGATQNANDVTLALRGERIPLRNAVSSAYNRSRQELLVATPAALYLYGKMLTAGGDLLATLPAEENVCFQFVVHLPWLDAYSLIASHASGKIDHRIVSSDLKTSLTSHTLLETDGQFYTALANPYRRELITADTDGGIKVWALRVIPTAQNNGGFKGVMRVHTAANSVR